MTIMTKMEDHNIVAGLERTHSDMHSFQYVREIYQNSVEAGATDIRFIKDKIIESFDINKGAVIDNGPGIPKDKIKNLINKKNSSSKEIGGADQNFGVGLKVAGLPKNKIGIVVICRTKDRPKGFMIWLAYGEDRNGYTTAGLKGLISLEQWMDYDNPELDMEEPIAKDLIDFQEMEDAGYSKFTIDEIDWMSWWSTHTKNETGTAIILLGNKANEDTFKKLVLEGKRFLSSRYLNYPVRPKFRRPDRDSFVHMNDPIESLKRFSIDNGCITFNSWKIYYYVANQKDAQKYQEYQTTLTHKTFKQVLLYKNEIYGEHTNLNHQTIASLRNSWGILYKSVGDRITIIVEPPVFCEGNETGVYPNEARSKLSWKDSKDSAPLQNIPLDEVKHYFKKNMPGSILELIKQESSKESNESKPSKLANELKKYLSVPKDRNKSNRGQGILISNLNGDLFGGDPTGQLFNQQGQKNEIVPPPPPPPPPEPNPKPEPTAEELEELNKKKKAKQQAQKFRQEPPRVLWETKEENDQFDEWFKRNGDYHVCYYERPQINNSGNKLRLNTYHEGFNSYKKVVNEWLTKKSLSMTEPDIMKYMIKPAFNELLPIKIQNAKSISCIKHSDIAHSVEALSWLIMGEQFDIKPKLNHYYNDFIKENPGKC